MASKTQKEKKDPMLTGYMFSYSQEKNPYDFVTDPESGLRPTQTSPPKGFLYTKLTDGLQYSTLPPLAVWKEGEWLAQSADFVYESTGLRPSKGEEYDVWVTSGEGTPGNFEWRLYLLPTDMSRKNLHTNLTPKHPMMWPKKYKEKGASVPVKKESDMGGYQWTGSGYGTQGGGWQKPKQTGPSLPAGVRIRCTKCGHWYRTDDLVGHVQCCPAVNEFSDWAIQCECCDNMDKTATVKKGFPREIAVVIPVVEDEVTVVEVGVEPEGVGNGAGAAATERPPDSPVDAA